MPIAGLSHPTVVVKKKIINFVAKSFPVVFKPYKAEGSALPKFMPSILSRP
jgi:hypothetical protein